MNHNYHEIDRATWPRRDYFYYFTKIQPLAYSVTVRLDITETLAWCHKETIKFNAVYLYLVCRLIMDYPEFRMAQVNQQLIEYEVLHPSYSLFHEEDHTISNMWTTFVPDFSIFYENYCQDQKRFGSQPGALVKENPSVANLIAVGMIPWLDFTNYTPLPQTPLTSFTPIIQAGGYTVAKDKTSLPLSMTVHHAVADGYHVSHFLNKLAEMFQHPQKWLEKKQ